MAKNKKPKIIVTLWINDSNPRDFDSENKSLAPPVNDDIASLFFDGCIKTAPIINTLTIHNNIIKKSVNENSSYPSKKGLLTHMIIISQV